MKIAIAEPYHSYAMRRPAAAIVQALHSLAPQVEAVLGDGPDLSADAGVDLVYHLPWHTLVGLDTTKSAAKQVMLYTHCNPGAEADLLAACQKADAIVCMAFAGRRELIEMGVDPRKLWVIPMGADGFSPRRVRVGVVGAVQPNGRKREHLLTELAWQMDMTPFQFVIVGTGWEPTVAALQNSGVAVEYHPQVGDLQLASLYRSMDVLLVTGFVEGGPLPLLEALACGKPVLTPRFGYAADLPLPSASYYASIAQLAQLLEYDYARPVQERAEMAGLYTWDWWAQEHLALFERLLGQQWKPEGSGSERPLRYAQLLDEIDQVKPKVIVEVGTHRGDRALQMIQAAAKWRPIEEIHYYGFDLWEALTGEQLRTEFSKQAPRQMAVHARLKTTGAHIHLIPGDTKATLKNFKVDADFIFVDGGHSHETIASDWRNLQRSVGPDTVVIFDDCYSGNTPPDMGCYALLETMDAQWQQTALDTIDWFQKPWGDLGIFMVKVRRRREMLPLTTTTGTVSTAMWFFDRKLTDMVGPEGAPV